MKYDEPSMPAEKKEGKKKIEDYEVDCAVDTLLRAHEVQANAPLMKLVMQKLKGKEQAIKSVRQLRDVASAKQMEEDEDDE